jgi:hypothetical protein
VHIGLGLPRPVLIAGYAVNPSVLAQPERDLARELRSLAASMSSQSFHDQPVDVFLDNDHLERRVSIPWDPHPDPWR